MSEPPYQPGDEVRILVGDGPPRPAWVSSVLPTSSSLSDHRWMLMCRWADGGGLVDAPLHCGDDGVGRTVAPVDADSGDDLRRGA